MKKTTAVILAAGLGTRMKTEVPKVLHKAGSKMLLERVILSLKEAGISDIIAVVGYKSEQIEQLFKDDVSFVLQPELLGSGDAVKRAVEQLSDECENVLVTCGDAPLIKGSTFRMVMDRQLEDKASCAFLTSLVQNPTAYGRISRDAGGKVLKIIEEKDATDEEKAIKEINVGTYCFFKKDLEDFIGDISLNEKKKEFYLTDIVDILKKKDKKIVTTSCQEEEIIGINSRKDLAIVNKIIQKKTLERLMAEGVTIIDPDNTYIDETAQIGKDTTIFPNTVIEQDVVIGGNCSVGPFARLRSGTKLQDKVEVGNFVEICRTEIGKASKVKHHSYLGDTVVGTDVNVGAGTITANYDGTKKHHTVIEDGAQVGVGVILVAPVKIGKGANVGAGSVVTKNKDVMPGETVIGVPARPLKKDK